MKKLLYPFAFILTAFLIIYSCSAEEDNTPPPSIIQTPEPEPPASILSATWFGFEASGPTMLLAVTVVVVLVQLLNSSL